MPESFVSESCPAFLPLSLLSSPQVKVVMYPKAAGRGIVASSMLFDICKMAGIHDIGIKCHGSRNARNTGARGRTADWGARPGMRWGEQRRWGALRRGGGCTEPGCASGMRVWLSSNGIS